MGPVTIRPATAADQPTIRRLIQEAGINHMSLDWPTSSWPMRTGSFINLFARVFKTQILLMRREPTA